ncbi:NAD(P)H-dependent FMN reductase [Lentibacillus persicus]|uniref:NAD(P)H-dependent FMN reductase n=1 Tax=Lentibacillus persicus TaxID=640948 RepID=A0A1I2A2W4_9BACI|nr:NADPH-dependent FMN reductase [Lentibacillus persicus]SFE38291.1 NAD(P)H-dependent FMN reductase [Lentibacillus persicus]
MKVAAIAGSIRENSYNTLLLETIKERFSEKFDLDIIKIDKLPLFNQAEELDPPEVVKSFKNQIADYDAVLISTPEYNWSVPGVLKNSLDWLSRGERPMIGKPVMVVGASISLMGTLRAQMDLRRILSAPGISANVLEPAQNEVLITQAHEKFDKNGKLTDEATLKVVDRAVNSFYEMVNG